MIKLIASDIDGTLVSEGSHEIAPQYFDVIRELKDVGIRFCACSGRQYGSMLDLFTPVADDIYFITSSGTMVRTRDRVLHSWKIDPAVFIPMIKEIRTIEDANVVVSGPDVSYIEAGEDSDFMRLVRDQYHYVVENVDDLTAISPDNILEISVHGPHIAEDAARLRANPAYAPVTITVSGAEWFDVYAKEAGKGEAFALLQEYLNVKKEETVYFGDNLNDLPAFHESGVTATVSNARAELKDAADIVERSYTQLGVLRELRNILGHALDYKAANE